MLPQKGKLRMCTSLLWYEVINPLPDLFPADEVPGGKYSVSIYKYSIYIYIHKIYVTLVYINLWLRRILDKVEPPANLQDFQWDMIFFLFFLAAGYFHM